MNDPYWTNNLSRTLVMVSHATAERVKEALIAALRSSDEPSLLLPSLLVALAGVQARDDRQ